tara:strand:+ start:1038 stop:1241 length:204 start_codon:yes stop_codon:yes gene_type:complete
MEDEKEKFIDEDDMITEYAEEVNMEWVRTSAVDAAMASITEQLDSIGVPKDIWQKVFDEVNNNLTIK